MKHHRFIPSSQSTSSTSNTASDNWSRFSGSNGTDRSRSSHSPHATPNSESPTTCVQKKKTRVFVHGCTTNLRSIGPRTQRNLHPPSPHPKQKDPTTLTLTLHLFHLQPPPPSPEPHKGASPGLSSTVEDLQRRLGGGNLFDLLWLCGLVRQRHLSQALKRALSVGEWASGEMGGAGSWSHSEAITHQKIKRVEIVQDLPQSFGRKLRSFSCCAFHCPLVSMKSRRAAEFSVAPALFGRGPKPPVW